LTKNDSIFLFEQVVRSDEARKGASGAYALGIGFGGAPTHFAVK